MREKPNPDYLTTLEVSSLDPDQLRLITRKSMMVRRVGPFNPYEAIEALQKNEGKSMFSIDFGGGKATEIVWTIQNGILVPDDSSIKTVQKEGNGGNYMPFFQQIAEEAETFGLDVALSFGGPLEGTSPLAIPNAPDFMKALEANYGGDFARLFPSLVVVNNDAQAGIKAAAIAVIRQLSEREKLSPNGSIMFPINGGGFGLALLVNNQIMATEVGHVRVIEALNPYKQTTTCGVMGNNHVCIERVAASGAGVEPLWAKLTGEQLEGREISGRYQQGNQVARELYANSAHLIAHGIEGAARVEGLMKNPYDTALVFHGGGFRVPGLGERVMQIVGKARGFTPPSMYTHMFSPNACAEGVAIAAFM